MGTIKKILSTLFTIVGCIFGIIIAFIASVIGGWVLRAIIWVICIGINFWYDSSVVDWISNHDTIMLIICSIFAFILILAEMLSVQDKKIDYQDREYYEKPKQNMSANKKTYVDASGAFRHFGDDFIDCKGNWCKWGSGFYDYDGNYIRWGETYKDSSGSYRKFGDDFVDGEGNWVRL